MYRDLPLRKELISIEDYMIMAAEIHYQLLPDQPNYLAILSKIFRNRPYMYEEQFFTAVDRLMKAYAGERRKNGPQAVIHPLRTAAIICLTSENPDEIDILGALFHDLDEDLRLGKATEKQRRLAEETFRKTNEAMDHDHRWYLGERRPYYTKQDNQPYYEYLWPIMDKARVWPDLLHVKLADRLDNTLDTHMYLPGVSKYNFYRFVFDLLFVPGYAGIKIDEYHIVPSEKEGVLILSQLVKNAIFLSMVRSNGLDRLDTPTEKLFNGLAVASIREAQWIALALFSAEIIPRSRQRRLILKTIEDCYSGSISEVHTASSDNPIDGMFLNQFGKENEENRKENLKEIFLKKEQLAEIIIGFIATFSSFINDSGYYIKGIKRDGLTPVE